MAAIDDYATFALAASVAWTAIFAGYHAIRAFEQDLPDRWSSLVGTLCLVYLVPWILGDGGQWIPTPFAWTIVFVHVAATVLANTFVAANIQARLEEAKRIAQALLEQVEGFQLPKGPRDREERRKAPHLLMGIFVPLGLGLAGLILKGLWSLGYGRLSETTELPLGIQRLGEIQAMDAVSAGIPLLFLALLISMLSVGANEFVRLRYPGSRYAFRSLIEGTARPHERGLFGAHFYMLAALPAGLAFLLDFGLSGREAGLLFSAILAMAVFGDAASALAGKRWGRTKWFHNHDKSYVGTLAGTVVSLAVALPILGMTSSLLVAVVFFVVDILAPVPFRISDNLLNPILGAVACGLLL